MNILKKLLKILLVVVTGILVLVVIGYFAIKSFLTPAYLRSMASKIASESLKRPVEIGHVSLRIGFKVGVTIGDISLPNLTGFSPEPMVQIDKTSLNFKLLPLLKREVVIGSIDLQGMNVKVERNKENKLNIAMVIMPKETRGTRWSFSLDAINIAQGSIKYTDAVSEMEIHAKDINQNIEFKGHKITISGEQSFYVLKSKIIPEMVVKIKNNIEYDTLRKDTNIKNLSAIYEPINLNATGTIEKMERLNITADLKIDDLSKSLSLIPNNMRPRRLAGSMKTAVTILGTTKEPKIDGRCELKNVLIGLKDINRELEKINGSLSFDQNSIRNILIQGQIAETKFDLSGSVANLKEPVLNLGLKIVGNLKDLESLTNQTKGVKMSGPLNLNVTIKGTSSKPSYFGDFSISDANIDGVGFAKPLSSLRLKGTIQNDAAKITECSGHIGRSDFSLNGYVSNFKKPVAQINSSSNIIDLDEMLPQTQKGKKQESKPVPVTLQGTVRINKLTGMDMEFKNINTNFIYENGVIDLKNCNADAFDGKVQFDFYYNVNSPEPYRITTRMNNLSAQKVLKRFLKFENLEAKLNGMSNFQGRGLSQKEVIANLSASGNLKFNNGVFKDFGFLTQLLSWVGLKDYKDLKFSEFICYFKIENGKSKVEDWAISSTIGNFLTNGTIGLDGKLNLLITLTLNKKESDLIKKYHVDWLLYFDKNGRAVIDMIASGKLTSPQFKLDTNKIKERLKGKIKDEWDKKKKELEKKLKDLLKG